ncbi:MAG TPA: hypothetical protein VJQ45_02605 [Ktedonobacterales bacterium]|nr:hypothetical protein [Ktedonobacterales bacterium]
MRGLGTVLAIIGILIIILAAVNHFASRLINFGHATTIVGVVGLVVLVVGAILAMMGGKASA